MTSIQLSEQYFSQAPLFQNTSDETSQTLRKVASLVSVEQGQTLIRNGQYESHVFLLVKGTVRLLGQNPFQDELFTVGKAQSGDLIGFASLSRQSPCEAAIARESCELLSFPTEVVLSLIKSDLSFQKYLSNIISPCEISCVLSEKFKRQNPPPSNPKLEILNIIDNAFNNSSEADGIFVLSTVIPGFEQLVGSTVDPEQESELQLKSLIPLRFISLASGSEQDLSTDLKVTHSASNSKIDNKDEQAESWSCGETFDLVDLGLKEASSSADLQGYKLIKGNGPVQANLATLRMVANAYGTPCPVDVIEKALEGAVHRAGSVSIQAMGQLAEAMGLQTQLGSVKLSVLEKLELPVIIKRKGYYCLLSQIKKDIALLADPQLGWKKVSTFDLTSNNADEVEVVLLKRLDDTPQRTFGFSWFAPVLNRFKWPLVQDLLASLFIQLFQLANPLLLQQIIDKVINQSNLSALQVLGAALVAAAFFQGLLTSVRTWLLIDTTDRMDLVLGTQVIDKLLRLPLRFFESRPVGELSQRLGELANIRAFLQGQQLRQP